jgi:hypothetical protein
MGTSRGEAKALDSSSMSSIQLVGFLASLALPMVGFAVALYVRGGTPLLRQQAWLPVLAGVLAAGLFLASTLLLKVSE